MGLQIILDTEFNNPELPNISDFGGLNKEGLVALYEVQKGQELDNGIYGQPKLSIVSGGDRITINNGMITFDGQGAINLGMNINQLAEMTAIFVIAQRDSKTGWNQSVMSNSRVNIMQNPTGQVMYNYNNGQNVISEIGGVGIIDAFQFKSVAFDNSNVFGSVNGEEWSIREYVNNTAPSHNPASKMYIGGTNPDMIITGDMVWMGIYDRALSSIELNNMYVSVKTFLKNTKEVDVF